MKMMRTLNGLLGERKTQLIEKIKVNFDKAFDELEQYAKEVGVSRDKFAKRDITISLKTSTSNFYALQANADTRDFLEEEMRKINRAIPVPPPSMPGGNAGSNTSASGGNQPKPRMRKIVHLNTHTTKPMRSETDVDIYLAGLKAELMQYINENNDIIIG